MTKDVGFYYAGNVPRGIRFFFLCNKTDFSIPFYGKGVERKKMASDFRKSGAGSCDAWCTLVYHGNDGCPHMYDPPCHHLAFM